MSHACPQCSCSSSCCIDTVFRSQFSAEGGILFTYEKTRGQKYRKEILPLGVNQLLQPWVTGFWLGRDPLSDEHLVGTAAGVMRSREVRRLQEPARSVPEALTAMLFTAWSPHQNLLGRLRLQRPAYKELVEGGVLPRFIKSPTATTTRNPKSEKFVTTPGDAEQSTKRLQPQTHQCKFLIRRYRNVHVNCHPLSEKEDSIPKRQSPAKVNTVLKIAGVYSGTRLQN